MAKHYIQMADIIGSSRHAGRGKSLMRSFRRLVQLVNSQYEDRILSPLTITLGDEFQGVPGDLATAVSTVVSLEEHRIKIGAEFKLRHVIHYGKIDTSINPERAHEMLGAGLTEARRRIEELKSDRSTRFALALRPRDKQAPLVDAMQLYFGIVDDWKPKDHAVVKAMLEGLDYKQAAIRLGRERTSTLRRYRSLQFDEYAAAKRLLRYLSGDQPYA